MKIKIRLCHEGADRYILFYGPIFVPAFVLSQRNFKVKKAHAVEQTFISQKFTKEQ